MSGERLGSGLARNDPDVKENVDGGISLAEGDSGAIAYSLIPMTLFYQVLTQGAGGPSGPSALVYKCGGKSGPKGAHIVVSHSGLQQTSSRRPYGYVRT